MQYKTQILCSSHHNEVTNMSLSIDINGPMSLTAIPQHQIILIYCCVAFIWLVGFVGVGKTHTCCGGG